METLQRAEDVLTGPRGRILPTIRLMREPRAYYDALFQEYGDPVILHALNGNVVLTGTPEGAKAVFSQPPDDYLPFGVEASRALVGPNSLFLIAGERHKEERKLLRPPFHGQRMKGQGETIARITREVFGKLKDGQDFIAQDEFMRVSLEVITRVIFGATDQDEVDALVEAIDNLLDNLNPLLLFSPKLQVAPLGFGPWAKFQQRIARLDALLEQRIARHKESGPGDDILSMLLESKYEDGSSMSNEAMRDELMTLLFAGHETTAIALSWALYHLHRSPGTLKTLRAEIDGEASDDPITRSKLPYLLGTCQETLRISPIVTDVLRKLNAPMEFMGMQVEAGWSLAVSIVTLHFDPNIYEDPEAFQPERFIDRKYSPFEYMPFGGGHRRCIGAAFAMFEMAIVLDTLLGEFELELKEPGEVKPVRRNITMGPETGIRMKLVSKRAR